MSKHVKKYAYAVVMTRSVSMATFFTLCYGVWEICHDVVTLIF